ncbi:MAG TPA: DASS family sodium-coupled anion symporter [Pyrinomonadaceae bacterium]|nr:DASS family sodium-coupled anion symporter [Pyrinomonadaceae bacterium]
MADRQPGGPSYANPEAESDASSGSRQVDSTLIRVLKWALVLGSALFILVLPVPAGITPQSWRLLAIFVATIVGGIVRPIPSGAVVLLGVTAVMLSGALSPVDALRGYADPIVWLVLAAFLISRGMIKTGLGRRIALLFVKAIGSRSLGLGYSLISTDLVLATIIPSNAARSGGIIFPIAKSIAETYESRPGITARRLGAFLTSLLYQADVIICAMFLTGQASNVIIAKFAKETTGIELTYARWAIAGLVPGLVSLAVVPPLIYRLFPPEIKHTPAATEFARTELQKMGRVSRHEILMLLVFGLVATLWMTTAFHGINYAVVAMLGIGVLLLTGVLTWQDVTTESGAWDVFIWYGGLVRMAEALGETGITKRFAEVAAGMTVGWYWAAALAGLLLVYFYAHYGFASITAHVSAMYIPFLVVIIAAGAPVALTVLLLAYASNLNASLTHYGTTPAPIWFGAGYVKQRTWWWLGFVASVANLLIWTVLGSLWWKALRWW